VPSESMVPTLKVGQVVGVDDGAFKGRAPRIGEIIVFHPPREAGLSTSCSNPREGQPNGSPCAALGSAPSKGAFVRRVVGLPGDRIAIAGGRVVRNGQPLREPYVRACDNPSVCNFPKAITVLSQTYFVMGDNRGAASDSRFWGPVRSSWIIGLAKP
jgi:signal peptidase I